MLGDLGSASPVGGIYICTYCPPEHKVPLPGKVRLNNNNEKYIAMAWELGMLLLYFFISTPGQVYTYNKFVWNRVSTSNNAEADELRDILEEFFGPDIGGLLDRDLLMRRSFTRPLYPPPGPLPATANRAWIAP